MTALDHPGDVVDLGTATKDAAIEIKEHGVSWNI